MQKPTTGINYKQLEDQLLKKTYKVSQAELNSKFEKIAFDIVRFKDDDKGAALWEIQSADDGEFIISLYEEPEQTKTASSWQVSLSKTADSIQFSYKGDPLVKLATSKLGVPSNELNTIERYLPKKLASNKELVKALLSELSEPAKKMVYNKYPELA